jgi:hypothetical protein
MGNLRKAPATLALMVFLSACGDNNITSPPGSSATPTSTLGVPATATAAPTLTVTTGPQPTMTSTSPAAATSTATASATAIEATATATVTPTLSPTAIPTPAAASALFSADPRDPQNPFPSDRLLDSTGHVDVPAEYLQIDAPRTREFETAYNYSIRIAEQLRALDGFSTFAPLRVRFDRPMTVDAGFFPRGLLLLQYDNLSAAPAMIQAVPYDRENTVEIYPVVPLKAKTRYALVVTNQLADRNGNRARPSADFAQLLSGAGLSPEQMTWRETLLPVIDYVRSVYNIATSDLVLVDVFTTQSIWDDLIAIKDRVTGGDLEPQLPVFGEPLGNLETGIFEEGTPQYADLIGRSSSPAISKVAIGYFDSFDFRLRANQAFDPEKIYGAKAVSTNKLDFYMVMPKAARPPRGYPIVLVGHGLGGSGRDVAALAELGRDLPMAAIGISALQHGRRGQVTNFFNLQNIATTREYFRQTVADFIQVIRMIERAHAAGVAPFDEVDPDNIMYLGGSLGGIMGTLFMAVEPRVQVGLLSVPGGGLPNILASPDISQLLEPLLALNVGIDISSPYFPPFLRRFQHSSQWALDSADPINYAPHIITPGAQLPGVPIKRILMHEGIIDNTVPNRATEDLALAMRLPDLNLTRGCSNPNGCSGIWRFVMSEYGRGETEGHGVTAILRQATDQAFAYLSSFGTEIIDASPPGR